MSRTFTINSTGDCSPCCRQVGSSCCEYPDGFIPLSDPTTVKYPRSDLPDALDVWIDGAYAFELTLNAPVTPDTFWLYSWTGGYYFCMMGQGWTTIGFPSGGGPSSCLIGALNFVTPGHTTVIKDQFLATYSVTDGIITDTVTRLSDTSCTWQGSYFTLRYNSATYKWTVSGPTSGAKNPPQNTPVGAYTNGITVS